MGVVVATLGGLIAKKKKTVEWWTLIHLLQSQFLSLKYLKQIISGDLSFLNDKLL